MKIHIATLLLLMSLVSCTDRRCDQDTKRILLEIKENDHFNAYVSDGLAYLFPEKVMLDFSYLNLDYGSHSDLRPDRRFTRESMITAFDEEVRKNSICLCGCNKVKISDYTILVSPWVENLAYVIVYENEKVEINSNEGFRVAVDGKFIEFLFERNGSEVKLIHDTQVNY